MSELDLSLNLDPASVDDVYHWLVSAHSGLSDAQSMRLNARLTLLLVNIVGDPQLIRAAIDRAASISDAEASQCT